MPVRQWRSQKNARSEPAEVNTSAQHLLILAPFKAEAKLIAGILPDCRQNGSCGWNFAGGRLAAANASGGGALLTLLDREFASQNYNCVVLFGAAGALTPEIELGQLFNCSRFIHAEQTLDLTVSAALPAATVITVDQPVFSSEARSRLNTSFNASLVDMESFFFAKCMHEKSQSCAVIRFVSDTASTPFALPFPASIAQNIGKLRAKIIEVLFD